MTVSHKRAGSCLNDTILTAVEHEDSNLSSGSPQKRSPKLFERNVRHSSYPSTEVMWTQKSFKAFKVANGLHAEEAREPLTKQLQRRILFSQRRCCTSHPCIYVTTLTLLHVTPMHICDDMHVTILTLLLTPLPPSINADQCLLAGGTTGGTFEPVVRQEHYNLKINEKKKSLHSTLQPRALKYLWQLQVDKALHIGHQRATKMSKFHLFMRQYCIALLIAMSH